MPLDQQKPTKSASLTLYLSITQVTGMDYVPLGTK